MRLFESIPRLRELDVVGRRVFLRADLDASRSPQGVVLEDAPLRVLLPTLRSLLAQRAKVILAASFGPPDQAGANVVKHVAARLGELLGIPVSVMSQDFSREVHFLPEGQVALVPDLASFPEELTHDVHWARQIASAVDVYILDGLQAALQGGTSVVELPQGLLSRAVGPQIDAALAAFTEVIEAPAAPFTLVLGGPTLPRLLPLINAVLPACTDILLGGLVANTFLVAAGWEPGASQYERASVPGAATLLREAQASSIRVHFPVDVVVRSQGVTGPGAYAVRMIDEVQAHEAVVDVAIRTCVAYRDVLAQSVTALWVGPMGDCLVEESQSGSQRVGRAVAEARRAIVIGNDTVSVSAYLGIDGLFRTIAGGDAMLSLLAGERFAGLEGLRR